MSTGYSCPGCDLTGHDFSGQDLTNANLAGATLTGANFSHATLAGADLTGAVMGGVNFTACDLTTAKFSSPPNFATSTMARTVFSQATIPFATLGLNWSYLDLSNATITGLPNDLTQLSALSATLVGLPLAGKKLLNAHLTNADLTGLDLSQANLAYAILTGANATGASFAGAQLQYAVFSKATLTQTSFKNAVIEGTDFTQTELTGTIFDGTDLTTSTFNAVTLFSTDPARLTSFQGAKLNYALLRTNWSCLNLANAKLVGLTSNVNLNPFIAENAMLTGINFSGYNLAGADFQNASCANANFTNANLTGTNFRNATLQGASFYGAALKQATLAYANCTGAVFTGISFDGANLTGAILTNAKLTQAQFNGANGATLVNAQMANVDASGAQFGTISSAFDLSPADETALDENQPVELVPVFREHGISLSTDLDLSMRRAMWEVDDQGNSQVYLVGMAPAANGAMVINGYLPAPFTLPAQAEAYLNTGDVGKLQPLFKQQDIALSAKTSVKIRTALWRLVDNTNQITYTIRKDIRSQGVTVLTVYTSVKAAELTNAYLPNANLTGANLYQVNAARIQLYGTSAKLDGATLEDANFNGANFGSMSLKQGHMQGVTLDNAVLTNAQFNGTDFTTSSTGGAASLTGADLPGADFTGALLGGATLTNAAVAVKIGTSTSYGVYLFSMSDSSGSLASELTQAEKKFSLNPGGKDVNLFLQYQAALDAPTSGNNFASIQQAFLQQGGVTLSSTASISTEQLQSAWQIVENSAVTYTVWSGYDANGYNELYVKPSQTDTAVFSLNPKGNATDYQTYLDALNKANIPVLQQGFAAQGHSLSSGAQVQAIRQGIVWQVADLPTSYTVWAGLDSNNNMELYVRPSMDHISKQFQQHQTPLRSQATVSAFTQASGSWQIDNDSANPQNFDIGYMKFVVLNNGTNLDVYGTAIHIQQLGANDQLVITNVPCKQSFLDPSNFNGDTKCPNGEAVSQQKSGTDFSTWMRAMTPPKPPSCVPNPNTYCPITTSSNTLYAHREEQLHD